MRKTGLFAVLTISAVLAACGESSQDRTLSASTSGMPSANVSPAGRTPGAEGKADGGDIQKSAQIRQGETVYRTKCKACHGMDGEGRGDNFPPVASSDYLNDDHNRAVITVINGLNGKITVNGKTYDSMMPSVTLSDGEVADVLTFLLNSFGNKGGQISPEQVAEARKRQ